MASLKYHWNFTGSSGSISLNQAIYDSESNIVAKVKRRVSGVSGGTYSSSNFAVSTDGITLDNNDSSNGGYYIDLEGLDTVNLGGSITIEMVIKNEINSQDTVYFQSIREFTDEDGNSFDDNIGTNQSEGGIVTSGFNNHSAFLKLFYKQGTGTRMQVRTDSRNNSTAKDGVKVNYSLKNATSGNILNQTGTWTYNSTSMPHTINTNSFHHYIIIIQYQDGDTSKKTIQVFVDGTEEGSTTNDIGKDLSDAVRQFNAIGTQKNPAVGATYLKGTVKYLKIYEGAMTDSEASTTYNNYNDNPYWSDVSEETNASKYTRRHDNLDTYFTNNPSVSSIKMSGNQLGLKNNTKTYNIHKFSNGSEFDITSGYHYVPLKGQNNFVVFKNTTVWYKITQTSANNGANTLYKYEISNNNGRSYGAAVTGKTFGETLVDGHVTIAFGGAESGNTSQEICFHKDTLITTDQGDVMIKDITSSHTINGKNVVYKIKSPNKSNKLVLIKKNAFGVDKPSRDILITEYHDIFINNSFKPIYKFINGDSIKLINHSSDVYNLILLEDRYINVSNLDLGVINMSRYYFNILKKYIKDYNEEYIYCTIEANNEDVQCKDINLNVKKFLEFNKDIIVN